MVGRVLVPAYDEPVLWEGHATMIEEAQLSYHSLSFQQLCTSSECLVAAVRTGLWAISGYGIYVMSGLEWKCALCFCSVCSSRALSVLKYCMSMPLINGALYAA